MDAVEQNITDFFDFARERHLVYLRRRAGLPRPWTTDALMNKYRFTNVFRELDKTTTWFRENVRNHYAESPTALLATLVFRMFNRIETGRVIFGQGDFFGGSVFNQFAEAASTGTHDPHVLVKDLKAAIVKGMKPGGPYCTGAYIVKTPAGMTKLDGILWIIAEALRGEMKVRGKGEKAGRVNLFDWGRYMIDTDEPVHLETAVAWLERLPYIGFFTAYEIVTDLRWTKLLDRAPDIMTWANPGPGCRRGIKRIYGGAKNSYIGNDEVIQNLMRGLLARSQDPKYWPQPGEGGSSAVRLGDYAVDDQFLSAEDWPRWEAHEVEMQLCENDKRVRALQGEGRPRGVFL